MAWHRTLVSVLSLLAFLVTLCVPATATHAPVPALIVPASILPASIVPASIVPIAVAGEPCRGTAGPRRCDVKLLPSTLAVPTPLSGTPSSHDAAADGAARGVWPEVEPDPPRA